MRLYNYVQQSGSVFSSSHLFLILDFVLTSSCEMLALPHVLKESLLVVVLFSMVCDKFIHVVQLADGENSVSPI